MNRVEDKKLSETLERCAISYYTDGPFYLVYQGAKYMAKTGSFEGRIYFDIYYYKEPIFYAID
jgi:hypothetical protein